MTSTESVQLAKKVNENNKKSPLKVVGPIIRKYSGHRQGKIKKKFKLSRNRHGGRSKQKQIKPPLKTILPKTSAGDVIILEPELLPCALNFQKSREKKDEVEGSEEANTNEPGTESDGKTSDSSPAKDDSNKVNKSKLILSNKKKLKCIKNIEASLELLESKCSALKEKREQAYAENYLLKVQQRLKGKEENLYNQFIDLVCSFQTNGITVCDLYKRVKALFSDHSDLGEDFVAFLTPEQAVECGVFMDHLLLTTMNDFLNMLDVYFSKSPSQVRKIHSVLESLACKDNVSTEYVTEMVLPLLKGNPVLRDYFLQLLPNSRPPDNFITDYEEIEIPEVNSDVSDDEDNLETIQLPEMEDPFGGDSCPCNCHKVEDEKFSSRINHCISCSMKFINGKIFIQQGKLLRPARVEFDDDHNMNYHRERLAPKLYPKRGRKRHRQFLFKDNLSPTKSCNLSSDEFKSDIEEDDRGRIKILKSPRFNCKKSVSPKNCDKILPRCILNEAKAESVEEEKPVKEKFLELSFATEEAKLVNGCDFISFMSEKPSQTEVVVSPSKHFDLSKIDGEVLPPSKLLEVPKIDIGLPSSIIPLDLTKIDEESSPGISLDLANIVVEVSPPSKPLDLPEIDVEVSSLSKPLDLSEIGVDVSPLSKSLNLPEIDAEVSPPSKPLDLPGIEASPLSKPLNLPKMDEESSSGISLDLANMVVEVSSASKHLDLPEIDVEVSPLSKPLGLPGIEVSPLSKPLDLPEIDVEVSPLSKPLDLPEIDVEVSPLSKPLDLPEIDVEVSPLSKPLDLPKIDIEVSPSSKHLDLLKTNIKVSSSNIPLDLPKIDIEDNLDKPKDLLSMIILNDSPKCDSKVQNGIFNNPMPVFMETERSRSPPVISIPETAVPLFSDTKPILSILETLDNSKELPVDLNDIDNKFLISNVEDARIEETITSTSEPSTNLGELKLKCNNEVVQESLKKEEILKVHEKEPEMPWKIEEDRIILQTLQVEENSEETFVKIGNNIPTRTVDDIKKRFEVLMNMLYEMKAKTNNG